MSMEKEYTVHETHSRSITALGVSPARREIYLGFEDGIVKSIELDTGTKLQTYNEHKGWITAFLYWPATKLLFCSSNDSVISVIGAGGNLMDKIFIGVPVYSMALNSRRREIILGVTNGLQFHEIFETKEGFSHYIEARPTFIIREHTDIVRCVTVIDSRIYSSGYDGALVIYDCHFTGKQSAVKSFKNPRAHDAGISCLSVEKDSVENNIWIFTGGFDRSLKIWTGDGKIVHRFDGFLTGVTGTCYIPKNKTIICLVGTNAAFIYDPKSGEDVSDFIDTFRFDFYFVSKNKNYLTHR
jgi:WD40 repeat protein